MSFDQFAEPIRSAEELTALMGQPSEFSLRKELKTLDEHMRRFIAHSPFAILSTHSGDGRCDASPRGDDPGFVHVVDERTLLIPDRLGNKRFDSYGVLTLVSRQFQNLHVHFVSHFFGMSSAQRVPRHTKTARREHLFAILIVGESTRFSHQRIDNVARIDGRLILADNPWHRLNQMTMMRHRDLFGTDAKVDEVANQTTRH